MATPAFSDVQSRFRDLDQRFRPGSVPPRTPRLRAAGEVLRTLALSSLMWTLLAGSVYILYSVIASGAHPPQPATWTDR